MFGDEKTVDEVSAIIEKQNSSPSLQDLYAALDWHSFNLHGKGVERSNTKRSCTEDEADDRTMAELNSHIFHMPVSIIVLNI